MGIFSNNLFPRAPWCSVVANFSGCDPRACKKIGMQGSEKIHARTHWCIAHQAVKVSCDFLNHSKCQMTVNGTDTPSKEGSLRPKAVYSERDEKEMKFYL